MLHKGTSCMHFRFKSITYASVTRVRLETICNLHVPYNPTAVCGINVIVFIFILRLSLYWKCQEELIVQLDDDIMVYVKQNFLFTRLVTVE